MKQITIAIPYYSNLKYLKLAVDSVIKQSSSEWKMVISCDDPNADTLQNWVDELDDNRIRLSINKTGLGLGGNLNKCLDLSDTPLVTLLHEDDLLAPDYVEKMLRAASRFSDSNIFFCDTEIINAKGRRRFSFVDWVKKFLRPAYKKGVLSLRGDKGLSSLARGNFIIAPTLCFRKRFAEKNSFNASLRFVLDWDLTCRALLSGETLIGLKFKGYRYRRHGKSTTSQMTKDQSRFKEELALARRIEALAAEKGWEHSRKTASRKIVLKLHLFYFLMRCLVSLNLRATRITLRLLSDALA